LGGRVLFAPGARAGHPWCPGYRGRPLQSRFPRVELPAKATITVLTEKEWGRSGSRMMAQPGRQLPLARRLALDAPGGRPAILQGHLQVR
jgi:hypothetical protein